MAEFTPAYKIVHGHEGGYANTPGDKGGETYQGISRVSWPNWPGWAIVDATKAARMLKRGGYINNPVLTRQVMDFYRTGWNNMRGDAIKSQEVANFYYDFWVNSGRATQQVQRVLRFVFGKDIATDNAPGPATVAALNSVEPAALHRALKAARLTYVRALALQGDNAKFLRTWTTRINSFPDLEKKSSDSAQSLPA